MSGNPSNDSTIHMFLATKSKQIRNKDWGFWMLLSMINEQFAPVNDNKWKKEGIKIVQTNLSYTGNFPVGDVMVDTPPWRI